MGFPLVLTKDPPGLMLKVTLVPAPDAKRCQAARSLERLHRRAGRDASDLISVATDGDRTLLFHWRRPDLDLGPLAVTIFVCSAYGAVYHRDTRRLAMRAAAGALLLPDARRPDLSVERAEELQEDLRAEGQDPATFPWAVLWYEGHGPDEPEERPDLDLPRGVPVLNGRRDDCGGLDLAFETVVAGALERTRAEVARWR